MLASKMRIVNGRVITKDEEYFNGIHIGKGKILYEKGGYVIAQYGNGILLKSSKGASVAVATLEDGKRRIEKAIQAGGLYADSKTKDESLDEKIRKMAREKADVPLNDDGTIRTPQQAQLSYERWYKILKSRYKGDSRYAVEYGDSKTKDALSYVTTYKGYEIAASDKNIPDKFLTTSKGVFLAANTLEELKKKIDKDSKTKDANPDGTISPDEEKRMAELLREANELKNRLKTKAYEIGGSFRGPGNWRKIRSILTSDSKTKDGKIVSISTPQWEGDIRIIDGTHFEMKAKGTDRWSWALHIGQADDHILNALKVKGALKDNGRFFITDTYEATKPKNIAAAKNLSKAQGQAASDGGPGSGQKGHKSAHIPDPSTHKERRKERANLQKYIENARRSGNIKEAQKHSQRLAHINSLSLNS